MSTKDEQPKGWDLKSYNSHLMTWPPEQAELGLGLERLHSTPLTPTLAARMKIPQAQPAPMPLIDARGPNQPKTRRVPCLRLALVAAGLTLTAMAKGLGVSHRTVSRWCKGQTSPEGALCDRADAWLRMHGVDPFQAWQPLDSPPVTTPTTPDPAPPALRLVQPGEAAPSHPPDATMTEADVPPSFTCLDFDELDYFHLDDDPFARGPDPSDCWQSSYLQRLERYLSRTAVTRRRITALVGPPGSGKTTLIRRLHGTMGRNSTIKLIAPATIDRRYISANTLAVALLRDLAGQDTSNMSPERRSKMLGDVIAAQHAEGVEPVVIIDEAHRIPNSGLLAVKYLWDAGTLWQQLSVILVGLDQLGERLSRDIALSELAQRTDVRRLHPLGADDVADYLGWQWARVHADVSQVFDANAFELLARRGKWPLAINNLAVHAMRKAIQVGDARVTAQHVGSI